VIGVTRGTNYDPTRCRIDTYNHICLSTDCKWEVEKISVAVYDYDVAKEQLSVTEVAAILGVNRARVHVLISDGRLAATKIGTQYAVSRRDLAKLKIGKPGRPKKS